ncbi:MAG TPA: hypothetical protein VJ417_09630, partial [Candidatus Glassbacteria bacterium]|nr:hypothetical protein [Candidatus Glassbacteria bacterium]
CLEEAAGRPIEFAEAARAFREGFAGFFGGDPVSSVATAEELRLAGKLVRERYGSREWLLKDNSSEAEELVTDTEPSGIRE